LLAIIESTSLICVNSGIESIADQRFCRLTFEAATDPNGQRSNDIIDLARARRIVLSHESRLELDTTSYGRTVFTLSLPLA
jgi:hypothetical protein